MALTATATQGFEHLRQTSGEEIFWLPGDPGVTFTEGDEVANSNGVLILATDSLANTIGQVAKSVVSPAATQNFPRAADFDPVRYETEDKCLVPVRLRVPGNVKVSKATFKNHKDDTVITYDAATRAIACTTGFAADDYPNGGLLYVYEGPGAGEVNIVEDYDHTGGAAELLLICHRAFKATLTSASKFIVVSGEAVATRGVHLLGRIDGADSNELDAADGADDGDYVVVADWRSIAKFLKNLTLPVIHRSALFTA